MFVRENKYAAGDYQEVCRAITRRSKGEIK